MLRPVLCDEPWERIAHRLPGKPSDPGCTAADNRGFVEAVLWVLRTGAPWRDLPQEFGNWNSTDQRFACWGRNGVWQRVRELLSQDADFHDVFIDSTVILVHQHGIGTEQKTPHRRSAAPAAGSAPRFMPWSTPWATSDVGASRLGRSTTAS